MIKLKSKKAAVEMSLNLIIMLIIGIVVLGLVIGFVNNLVNQGKETYTSQLNDNEKLKLEEVARCSENLCLLPDPSINIKKGERVNVFINVRAFDKALECDPGNLNKCKTGKSSYDYVVYSVSDDNGNDIIPNGCYDNNGAPVGCGASTNYDYFILSGPGFGASVGEQDAKMYSLTADSATPIGTYYLTITTYPSTTALNSPSEVSKTITLNVQ